MKVVVELAGAEAQAAGHGRVRRRKNGGGRRLFAPPSVLPDISPARGEIGRPLGLR